MCLLFTEIDGRQIENLDYHEMYNPSNPSQSSAEEMEDQKQHSAHQDEFILKHLFKKTGLNCFWDTNPVSGCCLQSQGIMSSARQLLSPRFFVRQLIGGRFGGKLKLYYSNLSVIQD